MFLLSDSNSTNGKKYNNKFYIFFIIQSGSNSSSALSSYFHYTELNHPKYIDSTNILKKENPELG